MSKRIRFSLSAQEKQSTDWAKCFICLEDKHEARKSPPMKIDLAKIRIQNLVKKYFGFAKINEMPIPLDIRRIDEGNGIEAALIKNEAKYHESCKLMFNNTNFKEPKRDIRLPIRAFPMYHRHSNLQEKVRLHQQKSDHYILKNISSVRNKHRVLNSVKL